MNTNELRALTEAAIKFNFNTHRQVDFQRKANPITVIALLDEIDRLTAERDTCGSGAGCLHKDALIESLTAERDALRTDAQRYQWLTADLDTANGRIKRNEILEQMSVMSYSAACMNIDAAMKGQP